MAGALFYPSSEEGNGQGSVAALDICQTFVRASKPKLWWQMWVIYREVFLGICVSTAATLSLQQPAVQQGSDDLTSCPCGFSSDAVWQGSLN